MRQLKIANQITQRDQISFDSYLSDIGKINLITIEDEIELAQLIKKGDHQALEKLVKANLRFVVSVAKQYQNQGLSLPDLINEGNLGLIKAAEKFDETRGFKFISYAVWWIRQSILQALAEHSRIVRLPLNMSGLANKINKTISNLEQVHGYHPSDLEVATAMNLPEKVISDTIRVATRHSSLDAPFADGDSNSLLDLYIPYEKTWTVDEKLINESLKKEIERCLNTLSERDSAILRMSFGIECKEISNEEIGKKLSLTKERVRQIKDRAINRLKNKWRSKLLKPYLD